MEWDETKKKATAGAAIGALLALVALLFQLWAFPKIIVYKVKTTMMLDDGTENMKSWKNLPTPLEFKVYMFNVTNPSGVANGEPPVLREMGPYVYDEFIERVDVKSHDEDDTLSYMSRSTYLFNQQKSGCRRDDDIVTMLNVPLLGTALMVEDMFPAGLSYVNSAVPQLFGGDLEASPLFLRTSVGEALFGSGAITIKCGRGVTGPASTVCRGIGARAPISITKKQGSDDFSFAYFRHKNYTLEGRYRIYRGREDISKLGLIKRFRNSTRLKEWPPKSNCARILGTDSTIFPPFTNSSRRVYIFISDICLSVFAEYDSGGTDKGLPVLRYTGSYKNFADPKDVPENSCKCRRNQSCLKSGLIDGFNCQGAPIIFSMPHLFGANEEYTNYAKGLEPDKGKHETFVLLEPYTSVPVEGRKRFQLNMFLKKIADIDVLANVSQGLFPLLWIDEGASLDAGSVGKLQKIYSVRTGLDAVAWTVFACGLVLVVLAAGYFGRVKLLSRNSRIEPTTTATALNAFPTTFNPNRGDKQNSS